MPDTNPLTEKSLAGLREQAVGHQMEPTCCLVRIYPAGQGHGLLRLPRRSYIIGRNNVSVDLDLADPSVSRTHARIDHVDGEFHIVDMQSTNGTYVNDKPVTRQRLRGGDYVRFGSTIYKFLSSDHVETQFHETIYAMMITDGLTGIHNRRYFVETLDRELIRSIRHHRPLSVAMFDIDHFKNVNDTYGHLVGDMTLRQLCARISSTIRKEEVFSRCGGEEFGVILPETTPEAAVLFGERIRKLVSEEPISAGDWRISITISIGIGHTNGDPPTTADELMAEADKQLYRAKSEGRNRVCA
jgi:two-component system cell cycle response regulator